MLNSEAQVEIQLSYKSRRLHVRRVKLVLWRKTEVLNEDKVRRTEGGLSLTLNKMMTTHPKRNLIQYGHDDFGRRIKVISPDTGTTIYSFDEAGNINQRSDARGTEVSYTYDALNRITAIQFTDNFIVRHWRSAEPTWGSWGSEEAGQ
jgi:YD repeat-containing protein